MICGGIKVPGVIGPNVSPERAGSAAHAEIVLRPDDQQTAVIPYADPDIRRIMGFQFRLPPMFRRPFVPLQEFRDFIPERTAPRPPMPDDLRDILSRVGLLSEDGRIKNGTVPDYISLFDEARAFPGGPMAIIRHPSLRFETSRIMHETPNAFLCARNRLAVEGREELGMLVPVYYRFIECEIYSLCLRWLPSQENIFNELLDERWMLARLYLIFETLRFEDPSVVREVRRYLEIWRLIAAEENVVKRYGADPALWNDVISAMARRDIAQPSIFSPGVRPERPPLFLPPGFRIDGKMPWADHPLFQSADTEALERAEMPAFSGEGFQKVNTHDDSLLFYRYQIHPRLGTPEVIVTGEINTLAEMVQRLAAANGGIHQPVGSENMIHPLNRLIEQIKLASFEKPDEREGFEFMLSNRSTLYFRFNPVSMMFEVSFGLLDRKMNLGSSPNPRLNEGRVLSVWLWTLEAYLKDVSHEREITMPISPRVADFREAAIRLAQSIYPGNLNVPQHAGDSLAMLGAGGAISGAQWAEVGVKQRRDGSVSALTVRIFGDPGLMTFQENSREISPAVVAEGRPQPDGQIKWKCRVYEPYSGGSEELVEAVRRMFGGQADFVDRRALASGGTLLEGIANLLPAEHFPQAPENLPKVPLPTIIGGPVQIIVPRDDTGTGGNLLIGGGGVLLPPLLPLLK